MSHSQSQNSESVLGQIKRFGNKNINAKLLILVILVEFFLVTGGLIYRASTTTGQIYISYGQLMQVQTATPPVFEGKVVTNKIVEHDFRQYLMQWLIRQENDFTIGSLTTSEGKSYQYRIIGYKNNDFAGKSVYISEPNFSENNVKLEGNFFGAEGAKLSDLKRICFDENGTLHCGVAMQDKLSKS
ncbi:hypothetical protein ACI0X9_003372 [Cronobacter turicensis]